MASRRGPPPNVSIPFKRESVSKEDEEFNIEDNGGVIVSIPFKRESVSKGTSASSEGGLPTVFQFPSNGKVYPKLANPRGIKGRSHVSIPFKRESVSKGIDDGGRVEINRGFQFPSNGKVYPKVVATVATTATTNPRVSIPFKRESVSKADCPTSCLTVSKEVFQFPSNGKVYPKSSGAVRGDVVGSKCFNSLQTGKCIQSSMD